MGHPALRLQLCRLLYPDYSQTQRIVMQAKNEMLFFELHKSRILLKKQCISSVNDRTEFRNWGQYFTVTTPSSSPEKQTGLRQLTLILLMWRIV